MRNDPFLETGEFMIGPKQQSFAELKAQDRASEEAFDRFLNPLAYAYVGHITITQAVKATETVPETVSVFDDFGVIAMSPNLAI